jgi:GDP-L-fucose synthase
LIDLKTKRLMVTGGGGFFGRFVVQRLQTVGCEQIFVPRSAEYDLRQAAAIEQVMHDEQPEIVIHMAAKVGGIQANRNWPGTFFYDNLMMGVQLMEAARRFGVEKFVTVGTICAYPEEIPVPFQESYLWHGYPEATNAPYGLAKKMLLVQGQAYRQQYAFKAIYLLVANLYGPGDSADLEKSHVIPAMIRKFLTAVDTNADEVVLWGDGSPTREFLFVADGAVGVVTATELYDKSDPINIGTGSAISIRDLAAMIAAEVGFNGRIVWDTTRPNGQPCRQLDVSRAKAELGFTAPTHFREGLHQTIEWYRQQLPSYVPSHS